MAPKKFYDRYQGPAWSLLIHEATGTRADGGASPEMRTARLPHHWGREEAGPFVVLHGRDASAQAVASSSRLRVRFGSTGMPGPMVVVKVTFFR